MKKKRFLFKAKGKYLMWFVYQRNPIKVRRDFEKRFIDFFRSHGIEF